MLWSRTPQRPHTNNPFPFVQTRTDRYELVNVYTLEHGAVSVGLAENRCIDNAVGGRKKIRDRERGCSAV